MDYEYTVLYWQLSDDCVQLRKWLCLVTAQVWQIIAKLFYVCSCIIFITIDVYGFRMEVANFPQCQSCNTARGSLAVALRNQCENHFMSRVEQTISRTFDYIQLQLHCVGSHMQQLWTACRVQHMVSHQHKKIV